MDTVYLVVVSGGECPEWWTRNLHAYATEAQAKAVADEYTERARQYRDGLGVWCARNPDPNMTPAPFDLDKYREYRAAKRAACAHWEYPFNQDVALGKDLIQLSPFTASFDVEPITVHRAPF